jgi:hypothetical protein
MHLRLDSGSKMSFSLPNIFNIFRICEYFSLRFKMFEEEKKINVLVNLNK